MIVKMVSQDLRNANAVSAVFPLTLSWSTTDYKDVSISKKTRLYYAEFLQQEKNQSSEQCALQNRVWIVKIRMRTPRNRGTVYLPRHTITRRVYDWFPRRWTIRVGLTFICRLDDGATNWEACFGRKFRGANQDHNFLWNSEFVVFSVSQSWTKTGMESERWHVFCFCFKLHHCL